MKNPWGKKLERKNLNNNQNNRRETLAINPVPSWYCY